MAKKVDDVAEGAPFLFEGDLYEVQVLGEKVFEAWRPEGAVRPIDALEVEHASKPIAEYRTVAGKREELRSVRGQADLQALIAAEGEQETKDRLFGVRNQSKFVQEAVKREVAALTAKVSKKAAAIGEDVLVWYLPWRIIPRAATYLSAEDVTNG